MGADDPLIAGGLMSQALCGVHVQAARRHWWFQGRRIILRSLLATLLPPGPERLVVEVGCGTGENLAWLSQDYQVLGVEPSPPAAREARNQVGPDRVIQTDTPDDVPDYQRADAVLILDVLEHVEEDAVVLNRWVAPMKDGCLLLVTVPADPALWSRHDETYGHYRRYELGGFRRLLETQPVELLLVSYFNARLYWLIRAARSISYRVHQAWGPDGTDLWIPPSWLNGLLAKIFSGEARRLVRCLRAGSRRSAWGRGVSLVAAARRRCAADK